MMKNVFVTGGNAGIGLALCKQLAVDYGCRVFMGSRNAERGQAAVDSIELPSGCPGSVELVLVDVADDSSVAAAACYVEGLLGGEKIYGLVNNAGVGLAAKASCDDVVNTNLFGPKRMFEAFSTLLDDATGRVVNVGSGSGPNFVKGCPQEMQNRLCTEPESWSQIESWLSDAQIGVESPANSNGGYGISKAFLASYTMLLAKENPRLLISCCTPGFIDTKLTAGFGASKPPEEGTLSIRQCLFGDLEGNGYYYGSDGVRSPYHFMRSPGELAYDGVPPSPSPL
jgi:NAD(P)-dependent dehydrogenase (short-subunit alcohol dehydrogenase family)